MPNSVIAFAPVPPGSFQRGLPDGRFQTVHVTKTVNWQTEPVTTGQYLSYLEATSSTADPRLEMWNGEWKPGPKFSEANVHGENVPVVGVSYLDALAFASWLSQQDGHAYRLPTEGEFAHAVRAGCSCTALCDGSSIFRREHTDRAWPEAFLACWNTARSTPNAYGIRGLNGVIWHWCADWFAPYADDAEVFDPQGPAARPTSSLWKGGVLPPGRVIRGGSYSYPEEYGHCDNRHFSFSVDRNVNLGFRLVFESN